MPGLPFGGIAMDDELTARLAMLFRRYAAAI